jgi:hypothetical protein
MMISKDNAEIRRKIFDIERKIESMHLEFQKYRLGEAERRPDIEKMERDLLTLSKRKILDLELSKQMDRVMYKFQNRKRIWLNWVEEYHKSL